MELKFSNDTIHIFKTANGEVQGIARIIWTGGMKFDYEILYDLNRNTLIETTMVC